MRSDQYVAIVRSRAATAQGIRMSSIWYSEMRTKPWQRKRGKHQGQQHQEAVPQARARIHLHICKLPIPETLAPQHADSRRQALLSNRMPLHRAQLFHLGVSTHVAEVSM